MSLSIKQLSGICLICAAAVLTGCSSSDSTPTAASAPTYTGNTDPAAITATNSQAMGKTATEAVNEAISASKASEANLFALAANMHDGVSISRTIEDATRSALNNAIAANLPVGMTITSDELGPYYCGGSITIPDDAFQSGTLNGSFQYNNLCYDDGYSGHMIVNGTVVFSETATGITMTYVNFTINVDGVTQSFNATITP